MGLNEATYHHWGDKEPNTCIGGMEPTDSVCHASGLEVSAVLQLPFHEGVGDTLQRSQQ
jgi:hypothetical protein